MNTLVLSLNKLSTHSLAFDELALRHIPDGLYEAVGDYAREILANKEFVTNYKSVIILIIKEEIRKKNCKGLLQQVLIREEIWKNATKNLNTLALNTAIKHIKMQLRCV
jgi:hypothetical protein